MYTMIERDDIINAIYDVTITTVRDDNGAEITPSKASAKEIVDTVVAALGFKISDKE